jgi:hypothetical protein
VTTFGRHQVQGGRLTGLGMADQLSRIVMSRLGARRLLGEGRQPAAWAR